MSTNIFIVDAHPQMLQLLCDFMKWLPDVVVCGVAVSGQEALEQLPKLPVDLVLVDASLGDINSIAFVETLFMRRPELPCLIHSGRQDVERVHNALAAGARGYIVKGNPYEFPEAIRLVLNDEIYLSPQVKLRLTNLSACIEERLL